MRLCTKLLYAVVLVAVALSTLAFGGVALAADEPATAHYLAFASDRHSNASSIGNAMSAFDPSTEYVALIGDMVNGSSDYATSTVKSEVQALFERATVDIMWGTHDVGATDDAEIMNMRSGVIYTGTHPDGSVAYYVYGIAFGAMSSYVAAQTASDEFRSWVDGITDEGAVIFVVCHMPMHAQRNDNNGGYVWSQALNYAATGATDDSAATGSTVTVRRNVVFLHGHNHTTEHNAEYYYAPESTVTMEDNGADVPTQIHFTYLTAGYLNANAHATQVTLTDSVISFNRSGVDLGAVAHITHAKGTYHEAVAPTCSSEGSVAYWDCPNCANKLDAELNIIGDVHLDVEPTNHAYVDEVTEPTATARGYTTHTCTRCGDSYVDTYVEPHSASSVNPSVDQGSDTKVDAGAESPAKSLSSTGASNSSAVQENSDKKSSSELAKTGDSLSIALLTSAFLALAVVFAIKCHRDHDE